MRFEVMERNQASAPRWRRVKRYAGNETTANWRVESDVWVIRWVGVCEVVWVLEGSVRFGQPKVE